MKIPIPSTPTTARKVVVPKKPIIRGITEEERVEFLQDMERMNKFWNAEYKLREISNLRFNHETYVSYNPTGYTNCTARWEWLDENRKERFAVWIRDANKDTGELEDFFDGDFNPMEELEKLNEQQKGEKKRGGN